MRQPLNGLEGTNDGSPGKASQFSQRLQLMKIMNQIQEKYTW
jgi:hypothetical protein